MGVVQVRLPDELQEAINRQVAAGRVADAEAFLAEAVRRYVEDLEFDDDSVELEDELAAEARAGIADIEAGRFRTVSTREELAAMEAEVMARVRDRLAADKG